MNRSLVLLMDSVVLFRRAHGKINFIETITKQKQCTHKLTQKTTKQSHKMTRKVGLVGGQIEAEICDLLPANKGRSSLVHRMISAYGLDKQCEQITVKKAKKDDLLKFHDSKYVEMVLRERKTIDSEAPLILREKLGLNNIEEEVNEVEEVDADEDNSILEQYGLLYDSHVFSLMSEYVKVVAGASISAARYLLASDDNRICLNWNGGRHHAKKLRASGFCYINDIVLSILELRKKFNKIMYIDLDLHHGDGVETAFKFSDKVVTFSIHRKELGFFPGTGSVEENGKGKGLNSCFNVPIRHGLSDQSLAKIVDEILLPCIEKINPDCLCIQCGCDGLNSDEHKEWNLTIKGFGEQVEKLLNVDKPSILFGGGGYNHDQVARCWTYLTNIALESDVEFDILPDSLINEDDSVETNYEFWNVKPMNMKDENDSTYLEDLKETILNRLI